jgi:hypothetical protein
MQYQLRIQEYTEATRTDVGNALSGTLLYTFNNYVGMRAFVEYTDNNSTLLGRDYQVLNAGGSLYLSVKF